MIYIVQPPAKDSVEKREESLSGNYTAVFNTYLEICINNQ